ncbi:MAG: deoxyribonuclease IV [Vicinamibacterales bacterium]|nr:deoxyribonuclease IV [Vicinamibacterales bacterium]MDP7693065.1 deoxyribonuclease IV [Vicinamibacterales bacterium]HJN45169.1 deoxyribonuclease IV [Vicinamibacterales bacterium]
MPRLGAHMSIAGGLPRAVERARAAGCDTLQIFTRSSGQWRARPLPDSEIAEFRRLSKELDVRPVIAHASYLINLATPDDTLRQRSRAALGEELDRAETLGLLGVVLHPGSYTTTTEEAGLTRIAESIGAVLDDRPEQQTTLLLEHTAGQGTNLGYTFEQLGTIITEVERAGTAARIGVCLDTCHLLAAGYDLGSDTDYADTMRQLDACVGFERLRAIHLNDSKTPLGSRVDRHTHIGSGHVGLGGFRRLLSDSRLEALPMVLETPKERTGRSADIEPDPMDLENLRTLRELMKAET